MRAWFGDRMALVLLCSAWWPSLPGTAIADGTYVKFGPGGVVPLKNDDIQLVRETVELEVARKHLLDADSRVRVRVTYLFRNHSNRSVKVHMGFPVGCPRTSCLPEPRRRCADCRLQRAVMQSLGDLGAVRWAVSFSRRPRFRV